MNTIVHRHTRVAINRDHVISRRDVLRGFSAAALASGALGWTDTLSLHADELRRQGRACILLWMAGGPSQFETFDPKPGHANGGETKAIATKVPGLQFADNLPRLAQVADRLAVIRSMTTREGEHQRASFLMHTSYLPLASVQFPTLGAVAAHEVPQGECELPAFVRIGSGRGVESGGGGFLGSQYDAFVVNGAGRVPDNSQPTTDTARFQRRLGLMGRLASVRTGGPAESDEHQKLYENASRMILSPQMQAFDLEREPASIREAYGMNQATSGGPGPRAGGPAFPVGQFGAACLLARRLVEAGATFIETTIPGWDTHNDNFNRSHSLCEALDRPFAYLIEDLEQRGLLDKTLIVWMGEFGRTPRINPNGGRDHFPRAFSAVLAGGGVHGGSVIGATDASGEAVKDRPVTEKDLFQTIYKSLQIDARKQHLSPIGRPIRFVDGGQAVDELLG